MMKNEDVLSLLESINDIVLGAPITDARLGDVEQWLRLENECGKGARPAVQAIIVALVRDLKEARANTQTNIVQEIDKSADVPARATTRRLKKAPEAAPPVEDEAPVEEAPAEDAPVEEPVLAAVGAEDTPSEAPTGDGEW